MKKLVPLKGYVLITFENEGELRLSSDVLESEKNGLVVEKGYYIPRNYNSSNSGGGGSTAEGSEIEVGDRIYFTNITGRVITNENGSYAFINYSDIIGKELK